MLCGIAEILTKLSECKADVWTSIYSSIYKLADFILIYLRIDTLVLWTGRTKCLIAAYRKRC